MAVGAAAVGAALVTVRGGEPGEVGGGGVRMTAVVVIGAARRAGSVAGGAAVTGAVAVSAGNAGSAAPRIADAGIGVMRAVS